MKVTIIDVIEAESRVQVRFDTDIGLGIANWQGNGAPSVGRTIDVEIDIEDAITLANNASICDSRQYGIRFDDKKVTFRGVIDDQDEDGMSYLRIASDCLIMVESKEVGLKGKWLEVSVPTDAVEMTPIGD